MIDIFFIALVCIGVVTFVVIVSRLLIGNSFFSIGSEFKKTVKIVVTTVIVTSSFGYYFFIILPRDEALKSQDAKNIQGVPSLNAYETPDNQEVVIVAPESQIPDTESVQPSAAIGNTEQKSEEYQDTNDSWEQEQKDIAKERKKVEEANKKRQEAANKAQLSLDKAAYDAALERLSRDYEYSRDKVNAEIVKNGLTEPYSDCADGTRDEQRCQINNRAYAPYQVELDYLEKTYKANIKALNAAKYW